MDWRAYARHPALADFVALDEEDTRMLVRRGYEPWAARLGGGEAPESGETVPGGRVEHPLVRLPDGTHTVVRRYQRGGLLRHLNRSRYFRGHRAFAELLATERARAAGVQVPEVLAAAEHRAMPGYTATLATRFIPDALEGAAWLSTEDTAAKRRVLGEAGRQIARMHAAGIAHPDLNLRNLLIRGGEQSVGEIGETNPTRVYLLDFDRARCFPGPVPRARRARDLLRLGRSARKLELPLEEGGGWAALRTGYGPEWPLPDRG